MIGLVQRWLGKAGVLAGMLLAAVGLQHWDSHPDARLVVGGAVVLAVTGWLMVRRGERGLGWRK